ATASPFHNSSSHEGFQMLCRKGSSRRGVAATEMAVLLPVLGGLLVIAIDLSRIFYYSPTLNNCARNDALWRSDPDPIAKSSDPDMTAAALADAQNVQPAPTVTSNSGVDADGRNYVECTVTYNFQTVTNLPLVPSTTTLTRTIRAYVSAQVPN